MHSARRILVMTADSRERRCKGAYPYALSPNKVLLSGKSIKEWRYSANNMIKDAAGMQYKGVPIFGIDIAQR